MRRCAILAIEEFEPDSAAPGRDRLEVGLDCGHRARLIRLARLRGAESAAPHADLLGREIECRRCRSIERMRRRAGATRRRSPALVFPRPRGMHVPNERRFP